MMLEVVFHPGAHHVILEPTCAARPRNPVHGIRLPQSWIEVLGDRLQTEDHRVHADYRHEPEDDIEQDSSADSLEEDELTQDDQLCHNFPTRSCGFASNPAGAPDASDVPEIRLVALRKAVTPKRSCRIRPVSAPRAWPLPDRRPGPDHVPVPGSDGAGGVSVGILRPS